MIFCAAEPDPHLIHETQKTPALYYADIGGKTKVRNRKIGKKNKRRLVFYIV